MRVKKENIFCDICKKQIDYSVNHIIVDTGLVEPYCNPIKAEISIRCHSQMLDGYIDICNDCIKKLLMNVINKLG